MPDLFGKILKVYSDKSPPLVTIRRDDGYGDYPDIGIYFDDYPDWDDCEKEILKYVQGKVLDIGAGAGRHALYLQKKGFEVHAIDISPGAVKIMKQRGVKNVYLKDLRNFTFLDNYFDSILMMFNNFGLAGSARKTKKLLKALYQLSTPKGRIITTIRDPYKTDNPRHFEYHEKNRKQGKPAGQVKVRFEYGGEVGDWIDLLMVSPEELEDLIKDTGWEIEKIAEGKKGFYGVVLIKKPN